MPFNNVYENTTVLVTGHTGFKGAWLTAWLLALGADVIGYSLEEPPTEPNLYDLAGLADRVTDVRGDVRDWERLWAVVEAHRPKIIFHLAAQPIVHVGVQSPKMTFDTNAGGTVNLLEAVRKSDCVRAVVNITTDKVYANREWLFGYRENDAISGHAPYSASKAMAELAIDSYRGTYYPPEKYADHGVSIASVRAGNVIGGGDLAAYRLIPDCIKALMADEQISIRTPHSVRPWQHVLEPLSGYLWLGAKMLTDGANFSEAWNFGPLEQKGITTGEVVEELVAQWGSGSWVHIDPDLPKVEMNLLRLSWEKAATRLDWHPVYTWEDALTEIVAFFKVYEGGGDISTTLQNHIDAYVERARSQNLQWVS